MQKGSDNLNDRIKKIRKDAGLTQEQFAKRLGVKRNTVATYEMGRSTPIDAAITSICREFGVNEDWLRNGTEPMYLPNGDKLEGYLAKISKGNDVFIKDLIEVYMELDECSKEALKKIAVGMAKKYKEREH
jgi:transcriptional regulator with XRE-family HTH domain